MNRHDKLIMAWLIAMSVIIGFCSFAVTYACVAANAQKSSVMLIESQSIVCEQELSNTKEELEELKEQMEDLNKTAETLQEENDELKKSQSFRKVNGNYYLE